MTAPKGHYPVDDDGNMAEYAHPRLDYAWLPMEPFDDTMTYVRFEQSRSSSRLILKDVKGRLWSLVRKSFDAFIKNCEDGRVEATWIVVKRGDTYGLTIQRVTGGNLMTTNDNGRLDEYEGYMLTRHDLVITDPEVHMAHIRMEQGKPFLVDRDGYWWEFLHEAFIDFVINDKCEDHHTGTWVIVKKRGTLPTSMQHMYWKQIPIPLGRLINK